ncbi:type III PLP-dependent enzyme, partial [Candidatus Kaiserbacteria bacterium]|nr:type III PLP-dependent enzyme [Candidatus Kaiserbacteria bacterium]
MNTSSAAASSQTTRDTKKSRGSTRSSKQLPKFPSREKIEKFIAENRLKTPYLIVDLDVVESNYRALRRTLPIAEIFYAVKANPAPEVVKRLVGLGSSFDVASPAEVELVLEAGAKPENISLGNTIKKEEDIKWAYDYGVRKFAFDSEAELQKLARSAPGSKVFCRILVSCEGADWPLSRKFGCEIDMAKDLLIKAKSLGLEPYGVSFHVGSQQTRVDQWDAALAQVSELFKQLKGTGVELKMVNLGGGLPAHYTDSVSSVGSYNSAIMKALQKHFGSPSAGGIPHIITEPGRSLVGDAGVLDAEVVLVSKKSYAEDVRWVYLDIGKFGGLAETLDEAIKYRIEALGRKGATAPVILAGPSCDSADILYEKFKYQMPLSLQVGDKLRFHATGAYTASYSSVGFNGFAPLPTY